MSEYMAARMDDQITGAQSENERLADRIAELEAECARLRGDANIWQDDAFTLIGHAEILRGQGDTDMPAYFYGLAERICRVHVDEAHAQRVRELADAALADVLGKEST